MNATVQTLSILLRFRLRSLANSARSLRSESRLKIACILLLGGGLWWGLYRFARFSFAWLAGQNPLVAGMALEFVFHLFLFTLAVMLLVSNTIISYTSLFESREAVFLRALPVGTRALALARGADALAFSSWAVLVLWLPLFLAFGQTHAPAWWFLPAIVLAILLLFVLAASLGVGINLLVAVLLPRRRRAVLGTAAGLTALAAVLFVSHAVAGLHGYGAQQVHWLVEMPSRFGFLTHPLLPSRWITRVVLAALRNDPAEARAALLLLASAAAAAFAWAYAAAVLLYGRAWDRTRCAGGGTAPRRSLFTLLLHNARGHPDRILLAKDLTLFRRDPAQWLQFAMLLGLILVYLLNLRSIGYHTTAPLWKVLVATLNLCSVLMVLATLSTRFFYPLVSLEGGAFWALGLSPLPRSAILRAKFRFAFLCNLILAEGLILLSNGMLRMDAAFLVAQAATAAGAAGALAGLAVGLGAAFPSWGERSPSKIVSGFGGTLTLICAIAYVLAVTVLHALPAFRALRHGELDARLWGICLAAITLLSLLTALAPLRLGARRLAGAELL